MPELPYRYSSKRALPPRILATPRVYALLNRPSEAARLQEAIEKCIELSKHPGTKLHSGYTGLGDFDVETVWSPTPDEPDVFVILGPGDAIPFWQILAEFRRDRDTELLSDLVSIAFV